MLLENNTQVLFALNVVLSFDDSTTKAVVVEEGDFILAKFMYNGNKLKRAARIVSIDPIILDTQPVSYAATLMLDCSTKFGAERLKVASKDILDIRLVDEDFMNSLSPEFMITDDMIAQPSIPETPKKPFQKPGVEIAGIDVSAFIR